MPSLALPFRPLRALVGLAAFAAIIIAGSGSDAQTLTVQPSGRATTQVALTPAEKSVTPPKPLVIRIDYGQPHLRARQLHTGDLVPYDQPWRLGANEPTTLTSDVDLMIGGVHVPKGTHVLRALPARTGWKLLVEKNANPAPPGPGATEKPAEVVATIELKQSTLAAPLESFTMWLIPSTAPGAAHGELRFAWGTTMLATTWATK